LESPKGFVVWCVACTFPTGNDSHSEEQNKKEEALAKLLKNYPPKKKTYFPLQKSGFDERACAKGQGFATGISTCTKPDRKLSIFWKVPG
jgi:hypothetical protein